MSAIEKGAALSAEPKPGAVTNDQAQQPIAAINVLPPKQRVFAPIRKRILTIKPPKEPPNDSFTTQAPAVPRSQRAARAKKQPNTDTLMSEDMDIAIEEHASTNKDHDYGYVPSSPSGADLYSPYKSRARQSSSTIANTHAPTFNEEEEEQEWETEAGRSVRASTLHQDPCLAARIEPDIYRIAEQLANAPQLQIDLPLLYEDSDAEVEIPWSGAQITHLYLVCYQNNDYNTCDMIADTWIRAFQKADKHKDTRIWRPNNSKYVEEDAKQCKLRIEDPSMSLRDVTSFNSQQINELFNHTAKNCGARMIWADAMALCGDGLARAMKCVETGKWHQDLVFEIMQTSLYMLRRKLTLNIEEKAEGAWCQRYHEHFKHGRKCYRDLAKEEHARKARETEDVTMDLESPIYSKHVSFAKDIAGG